MQKYNLKTFSDNNIITILVESKLCGSRSEARRLVEQGGVRLGQINTTPELIEFLNFLGFNFKNRYVTIIYKGKLKSIGVYFWAYPPK